MSGWHFGNIWDGAHPMVAGAGVSAMTQPIKMKIIQNGFNACFVRDIAYF